MYAIKSAYLCAAHTIPSRSFLKMLRVSVSEHWKRPLDLTVKTSTKDQFTDNFSGTYTIPDKQLKFDKLFGEHIRDASIDANKLTQFITGSSNFERCHPLI